MSKANINIPERVKPILKQLVDMPEDRFKKIKEALATIPASMKLEVIVDYVQNSLPSEIKNLSEIIKAIVGMSAARIGANISVEELVQDVIESVNHIPELAKEIDKELLEQRLLSLLNIESVILTAQARSIQQEYSNIFHSAKIFSDIRPVFDSKGIKPVGAMIIHHLRIIYHQGGDHKELFFTLDNADLIAMKKLLEQAELKSNGIEGIINNTDLKYFESK